MKKLLRAAQKKNAQGKRDEWPDSLNCRTRKTYVTAVKAFAAGSFTAINRWRIYHFGWRRRIMPVEKVRIDSADKECRQEKQQSRWITTNAKLSDPFSWHWMLSPISSPSLAVHSIYLCRCVSVCAYISRLGSFGLLVLVPPSYNRWMQLQQPNRCRRFLFFSSQRSYPICEKC